MFPNRYDIFNEIKSLDPVEDHQRIVYLVGSYEYPWLVRKSLEFALFRTYASPRISRVLRATGQFQRHGQKRYDDTSLMLAGLAEHGYDSEFGRAVISAMNFLHGQYNIKNEDMLYVLSTFAFEPTRWHERYSWRKPTRNENLANYYFWREVGRRMHIQDIPATMEKFEAFNIAYERENFRYDDANRAIGEATVDVFLSWYPRFLRPIIRRFLIAFMDEPLRKAMGFKKPPRIVHLLTDRGLWLFGKLLRFMPPRSKPFVFTELPNRTYPDGFDVERIGAHHPPPTN